MEVEPTGRKPAFPPSIQEAKKRTGKGTPQTLLASQARTDEFLN